MTYLQKLQDPRWQKKKSETMIRDGFTCCDCGSTTETLQVHHTHYQRGGPWETDERYLLTVCVPCHKKRQGLEERARAALGEMFARMRCSADDTQLEEFVDSISRANESHRESGGWPTMIDENETIDMAHAIFRLQRRLGIPECVKAALSNS